ncbi:MAG: CoA transferase [Alphaproteobacteria bacterium]|jgi:crotonobetainyl-CoA:carnitine CoA-transferase CaiB-like acyl-CoA transferase|nr:MAG: CoA transferase [Alphaproteobacteria bacterium]
MAHDPRLVSDDKIEELKKAVPDWVKRLERPATPCITPTFGPLEGIRVVGTGCLVAQPYIGTKLAEFGAEVIHVERPGGDVFRFTAPQLTRGPRPHGCDEAEVTKNKLSLGLDLKQARGLELLMGLWKISDVWMESSMPGTLDRSGITNELALAVNPSLVIVRVSSYGQYGSEEYLGRAGYDAIAQAYGGMMNLTGDPAGPPQRAKTYTGDYITALTGWASTMMALWEVKKSGRGQVVDLAQYEAVAQTNGNTLPLFTGQGVVYGHAGNRASGFQPYDTFKCSDGWVYIGALGGPIYDRVPKFLNLDPVEYSYDACSKDDGAVNSEKGRELDRRLREYCAARTSLEVETELNAAKIACARVYNTRDQYNDQHYAAREMTVPVLDRQSGVPIRVYGVVPKMSLTPGRIWRGAPSVGDDTSDILAAMLGLSETEIDALYAEQIVHRTEPFTTPQVEAVNP